MHLEVWVGFELATNGIQFSMSLPTRTRHPVIYSWMKDLSCGTDKLLLLAADERYPNYYLSRTQDYNDRFFPWWNNCFSETFNLKHLLPCLTVTSTRDLAKTVAAVSLPGPSERVVTSQLTTSSPQSGSGLVALLSPTEAIWNKYPINKCSVSARHSQI